MDIAAISLVNSQLEVRDAASTMVMKKAMETAEQNSQMILSTMQVPPSTNLGINLDIKV